MVQTLDVHMTWNERKKITPKLGSEKLKGKYSVFQTEDGIDKILQNLQDIQHDFRTWSTIMLVFLNSPCTPAIHFTSIRRTTI